MSIPFPFELSKLSIELKDFSLKTLEDRYYLASESSPQQLYWRCATAYSDDQAMSERMYGYFVKQWFGPASPVLSNAPERVKFEKYFHLNFKADCFKNVLGPLPISCFLSTVPDSRFGIAQSYVEGIFLNSNGGGRGTHWGNLRELNCPTSTGQKTGGAIPFVGVSDRLVLATNQGSNRRGADMCNMDISHPEIEEFIQIRNPTGDNNRRSRNIHNGVNIPDAFMHKVVRNEDWDLISPHTGKVVKTVKARKLWELCLETAATKGGEPMLHFIDASNRGLPKTQRDMGLKVNGSNLCHEITQATNEDRTAVCCLSSVNILKYNEWKNHPTFINDCIRFLDNIIQYFIENATANAESQIGKKRLREVIAGRADESVIDDILHKYLHPMRKAVYSATQERSLGLGQMGWASYFKQEDVYYDSREALILTEKISKHIHYQAVQASLDLGMERGEAPDMVGTGRRNSHVIAIAPTATNAIICNNVVPSREATYQNCYTHKTLSGSFLVKCPFLEKDLESLGQNTKEVWKSIMENDGSVQHLDFLSGHLKRKHKTSFELDQRWTVELHAVAQPYVCQAQSLNVFFMPNAPKEYLNMVHLLIWKRGLKTRYYLKSKALRGGMSTAAKKVKKNVVKEVDYQSCVGCEG